LRSWSRYESGKAQGRQQQWYKGGERFKELNIVQGREEGRQRAWRKNGKLYVNYEARNGRIFGLKRAGLCYELNNENIVRNE
ncbi:MAG: toxin-antitoxin system YwqK family antitoxin, partial [Bacteroidota bacterium]